MNIRLSLLNTALQGLDAELKEQRDRRLEGEGMSQSENQDKSIVGENDDNSMHSETEEELIKRTIAENEKMMLNPPTVEN
jgi:hypothetical protein